MKQTLVSWCVKEWLESLIWKSAGFTVHKDGTVKNVFWYRWMIARLGITFLLAANTGFQAIPHLFNQNTWAIGPGVYVVLRYSHLYAS